MTHKSIVSFPAEYSSTEPIKGDVLSIVASPKRTAPMEVACILDVHPLISRPLVEGQGSGVAMEGPSAAKGAVV
jgi:hypothetical protein